MWLLDGLKSDFRPRRALKLREERERTAEKYIFIVFMHNVSVKWS